MNTYSVRFIFKKLRNEDGNFSTWRTRIQNHILAGITAKRNFTFCIRCAIQCDAFHCAEYSSEWIIFHLQLKTFKLFRENFSGYQITNENCSAWIHRRTPLKEHCLLWILIGLRWSWTVILHSPLAMITKELLFHYNNRTILHHDTRLAFTSLCQAHHRIIVELIMEMTLLSHCSHCHPKQVYLLICNILISNFTISNA